MPRYGDAPLPWGSRETEQEPKTHPKPTPQPTTLELWKVLLHSDHVNDADHTVRAIVELTPLDAEEAAHRNAEAASRGVSLLLTTHRERAELYERQLGKANLHVTIESV